MTPSQVQAPLLEVNAGRRLVVEQVKALLQEEQRKLDTDPGVATVRYDIFFLFFLYSPPHPESNLCYGGGG